MTKFETILSLAAIRGAVLSSASMSDIIAMIDILENCLSVEFKKSEGTAGGCDHLYARKVCIDCGHHHE